MLVRTVWWAPFRQDAGTEDPSQALPEDVFHVSDKRQGQQHRGQMEAEALDGPESRGRRKVDPEALQVFKEARSVPRTLLSLCRVAVRRALGKYRLHLIPSLPLPDPIKKFLLYE